MTCGAFPDGIPLEIVSGDVLHLRLFGGEAEPLVFKERLNPTLDA